MTKLSPQDIDGIYLLDAQCVKKRHIAETYAISLSQVYRILRGHHYRGQFVPRNC